MPTLQAGARRYKCDWRAWGTRTSCGALLLLCVAERIQGGMQLGERSFELLVHVGARGCFLPLNYATDRLDDEKGPRGLAPRAAANMSARYSGHDQGEVESRDRGAAHADVEPPKASSLEP
jgi:hypothetical protein